MKTTLALISLLFVANTFFAQFKGGQTIEKIVAKVDNEIVLLSDLETAFIQYTKGGNPNHPELKCKILETLVINKLLVAKAAIDSITVDEAMIENQLDYRIQSVLAEFGGDEKMLQEAYGKTIPELKDELRPALREQLLAQQMQQKITGGIELTPIEIQDFYNGIPKDSLPFISTEVEVAQIVKFPAASEKEEQRVVALLNNLKERIEAGEDFCQLANLYSEDPGSKQYCGRLGYRKKGELVPAFEATALSMEPGEVSKPIKTQFGYHLIRLIDRRGTEYAAQHILVTLKTYENDMYAARTFLDSIRNVLVEDDSVNFSHMAHKYNEDKRSQAFGNMLTDQQGNTTIAADQLDHNIYFTIDGLQQGQISQPLKFLAEDGKVGVRILYLISKKAPHIANLVDDYQKIKKAATDAKKAEVLEEWFKKTLPQVYIYIDPEYENCQILKID
ncbi:peptidylprolyl isomerase [Cyclobacteriaceae bacterium]|nr:peptidylprolyl isomerase [Cyclobacteriaceae bacterium]